MRALVGQGFAEAIIQIITTWTSVIINSKTVKCIHSRKSKVMTQHHLMVILMVMIHFLTHRFPILDSPRKTSPHFIETSIFINSTFTSELCIYV